MKMLNCDVAVIGGGPAGLAAAAKARQLGAENVLILERDIRSGGILRQCVHDGFGLVRFGKRMSGGQYAQHFLDEVNELGIRQLLNTMVLEITKDRVIYACNETDGMLRITCGAIILAMGCRERTRQQVFIMGTRPAGILTAGAVQRYINIEGYLPGKKAVILGSGDIGLIMARRMTLEGMEVEGVYELMPTLGGLRRNKVQCLDEFGIPLHLSTTVTQVYGEQRLERLTVQQVDENRNPIPGTERYIECDLLVLAVGLIPENELSIAAGIEMDPTTRGPVVDESMMTSIPGIFACGNVAAVFDLVDYVSETGETAARGAVRFLRGEICADEPYVQIEKGENVGVMIPQRFHPSCIGDEGLSVYLRVTKPLEKCVLLAKDGDREVYRKRHDIALPPEMLRADIKKDTAPAALKLEVNG
ncbi:MAG: FAD-dependent oxidoreductase [Lachnospiraceae bacterium]|nr:FAD-dependent oxidoreductase [Lachnospiraceae bacterium]